MFAGRPHQAAGNSGRRWMITPRVSCAGTEPGLQVDSSVALSLVPEMLGDVLAQSAQLREPI